MLPAALGIVPEAQPPVHPPWHPAAGSPVDRMAQVFAAQKEGVTARRTGLGLKERRAALAKDAPTAA